METARKTHRPTEAKSYTRAILDCNAASSRHQWLITQLLRTTRQPNIVYYGTFCTKVHPCNQTLVYVCKYYLHWTTKRAPDGLQRHNIKIKCMSRFKTMAQGNDIRHIDAHRWRGMNITTMTIPSMYNTLWKICTGPLEFALHMEARKVKLDGHKHVSWPFSYPTHSCITQDGLLTRLQSYLHTSTNSLRDDFLIFFICFLHFIQTAGKIIASCNHCTTNLDTSVWISAKLKIKIALKSRNEILEKPRFVMQQKQGGIFHLEFFY